ncbi:P-loop NTPase family protein [Calothrix rhizosoleniae]|uniref:P-loop NTPase family protein n=1 Tax=Calothrix rhizosoleniae TaxID=888997 RepID=UPI000B4A3062|nr:P-loop NTPase family protein [Calothrix rhizosoleniae]
MVAQLENPNINTTHKLLSAVTGIVQVFTGHHRNFFTAVMAQSLRIAGQGTPVLIVQFLKGGINQGHEHAIQLGQNMDWIRCDLPRCIDTPHLGDTEANSLQQLWQYTQKVVLSGKYSLVVLDELSLAVSFGLIPEAEVLAFMSKLPANIDIIFTGPEMPKSILDLANQVTEVRDSQRSQE